MSDDDMIRRGDALRNALAYATGEGAAKAELAIRALPAVQPKVKPLVWHKSHIKPWREDWHTVPTGYTVRCADEWGWKWTSPLGAHGYENTPDIAKAAAQADYEDGTCAALEPQPDAAAAIREAARLLDDIVCGRGMFGVDPAQDLQWAVETAAAALALIDNTGKEVMPSERESARPTI